MIANDVAQFLLNNAPITAVTTEIRPLKLSDGHDSPAIVYMQGSDDAERTMDSISSLHRAAFYIDCYAYSYSEARTLAALVRSELESYSGVFGSVTAEQIDFDGDYDLFEDDTRLFRAALSFTLWYSN